MYNYKAKVKRVIDGDTVELEVDLGFGVGFVDRFRLYGIDTPEIHGVKADSPEYQKGMKSFERTQNLLPLGSIVTVDTFKDKKDKYGRYLARIVNGQSISVSDTLLAEGLAVIYLP